jgi:choline dehydrogenase-like flavoprotein
MTRAAAYAYVLVGSGVAASTIAKRLLSHDPDTAILMVEAGARIPARDRRTWWDYVINGALPYTKTYDRDHEAHHAESAHGSAGGPVTAEPQAHRSVGNTFWRMRGARITAYGGTTLHWGGWSLRMKPEDFYLHTNTGLGADWLLDYDDLEPYYGQAEEHLAVCGDADEAWTRRSTPYPLPPYPWLEPDMEMIEALETAGLRAGRMPLARYRHCMTTGTCRYCPVGARFSGQYVNEALEAAGYPNFDVMTGARVQEIVLDSRRRARGVKLVDLVDGSVKKVDANRVIVCAGAFESPNLLRRSGWPSWEHGLGNDADLVGRYLVSHSFLSVTGTSIANKPRMVQELGFPTLMSRSYDDEAHQRDGKIFMFRNFNLPGHDWAALMQAGRDRAVIDAIAEGPRTTSLSAFYEETGEFQNYIKPTRGTDQFGFPLMEINFNRSDQTMRNANRRLGEMGEIFAGMRDYRVFQSAFEGAAGFHASGTCRMGRTPADGVTDAELRVHGTDNVWVCSNAVFPSIGAVNPTLTLTALAFRLADRLVSGDAVADARGQA